MENFYDIDQFGIPLDEKKDKEKEELKPVDELDDFGLPKEDPMLKRPFPAL